MKMYASAIIVCLSRMGIGFAKLLLEKLKIRFPDCGTQVEERTAANYLDPCWKGVHLSKYGSLESTKKMILDKWSHLEMEEDQPPARSDRGRQPAPPLSPNSQILQEVGGLHEQSGVTMGRLAKEMMTYEALPRLTMDGDRLIWWKLHEETLPLLSKIAKEILCIPAASSKSERVFSIGTQV